MANAWHLETTVGYQAIGTALAATAIFLAERFSIAQSAAYHEKKERFRVFKALQSMLYSVACASVCLAVCAVLLCTDDAAPRKVACI